MSNPFVIHRSSRINKSQARWRLPERLEHRCLLAAATIELIPAENIELSSATIGVELVDSGGINSNLVLYWGDEDGQDDLRQWDNRVEFGSVGVDVYKTDLADLNVNTQYFYRAFAFNFVGGAVWSETASFMTLPPRPAKLESDPILIVGGTTAEISGRVIETGGEAPNVNIFYGTENGADSAQTWQHQLDLGVFAGEFSARLGKLIPDSKYFVRLAAINSIGPTWDDSTYEIRTADIPALRISEWMAANSSVATTRIRVDQDTRFQNDKQAFDWLEIQNSTAETIDLGGYHLTDSQRRPTKWRIPEGTSIGAHAAMVVYASGFDLKDVRFDENESLHTNFKLSSDGEYLAITDPNGKMVHAINGYPAQFHDASYGFFGDKMGFFRTPSPGSLNEPLNPHVLDVGHTWENNSPASAWTITAKPQSILGTLDSVSLHYRVMFEDEVMVNMVDDATEADAIAGDGIYTGVIPAAVAEPGQILRYYVSTKDSLGFDGRAPLFPNPEGSPEYFGTMIPDPSVQSKFPVLHRFVESERRAESSRGTRTSIFYDGEFYDNAFIRIRGGTAVSWPKKAYKIEFNDDHHFLFRDDVPRVDEINVNTTYTDKSYLRAILTSDFQNNAGTPSPESFHVRMQQNGVFFSIAIFVEQPDRDFLRRHGLDPDGSLYKGSPGANMRTIGGFEKKTRDFEDKTDLRDFLEGLRLRDDELEYFLFDNVNLPAQINFMATNVITQNIDASDKNYYLYRDTNGSGEWHMTPWDLDLTFGPDALNTDTILADENTRGASNRNAVHPFLGGYQFPLHGGKTNELFDRLIKNTRTQQMLLRRIRTMADEYLGTNYFQDLIDQMVDALGEEVILDREKWGRQAHFNRNVRPLEEEAQRIKSEYLSRRYPYLTEYHVEGGVGIPLQQAEDTSIHFGTVETRPLSNVSAEKYVTLENPNAFAVDVSNWQLTGAAQTKIPSGTVIPANESLYLAVDVRQFRDRKNGPSGAQGLFVLQLEDGLTADTGELTLVNHLGNQIDQITYGAPIQPGDFNSDGRVNHDDIDSICSKIRNGDAEIAFDLTNDLRVDNHDFNFLIREILKTRTGDANLDGRFDSADLVSVFRAGEYEDDEAENSSWAEGDWNCDAEFTSRDFVHAFRELGFVQAATNVSNILDEVHDRIFSSPESHESNLTPRAPEWSSPRSGSRTSFQLDRQNTEELFARDTSRFEMNQIVDRSDRNTEISIF